MTDISDRADLWLQRFRPPASATACRLICFPHAGGAASFFFRISSLLPASVDVLAVQYPGRQDRRHEKCIADVARLADHISNRVDDLDDTPIVLFGHSMGALLAFEVARRMEVGRRHALAGLVVSGRRAPFLHREEKIHTLDDDSLLDHLCELGGTDRHLVQDREVRMMIIPAIRADYTAAETYHYVCGPKLSCPLAVFTGDRDPMVSVDEARAWQDQVAGKFTLRVFPGGHFYLQEHYSVTTAALGEEISSFLSRPVAPR